MVVHSGSNDVYEEEECHVIKDTIELHKHHVKNSSKQNDGEKVSDNAIDIFHEVTEKQKELLILKELENAAYHEPLQIVGLVKEGGMQNQ